MRQLLNIRYFSLEIVAGALASAVLASRVMDVDPGKFFYPGLGTLVFLLYLADHLFDGIRYGLESPRESHRYFFRNRRMVLFLILLLLPLELYFITRLDQCIVVASLPVALPLLVYYAGVHLLRKRLFAVLPGEVVVAMIYTAGIWAGPLALQVHGISLYQVIIMLMFQVMVLENVFVISYFSVETDRQLGISSLALRLGEKKTSSGIRILMLIELLLFVSTLLADRTKILPQVLLLLITGVSSLIRLFPSYFSLKERYRYLADSLLALGFLTVFL